MISIKEKEEHLKKLNSELDSKRISMMQQLNQIKTDQEKNMNLSDNEGADVDVEAEEADDNYEDPEDFGQDRDSLEEGGRDEDYEEEERNIYKEKNIEDQIHDLKKKEEFQRIKKFDQLQEENEENGIPEFF